MLGERAMDGSLCRRRERRRVVRVRRQGSMMAHWLAPTDALNLKCSLAVTRRRMTIGLVLLLSSAIAVNGQTPTPVAPVPPAPVTSTPVAVTPPAPVAAPVAAPTTIAPRPTAVPTAAPVPTLSPAPSNPPTSLPTARPTITSRPTITPRPTELPSATPSDSPSGVPTFSQLSETKRRYQQGFLVPNTTDGSLFFWTENQTQALGNILTSYTPRFGTNPPGSVTSSCVVDWGSQQNTQQQINITVFLVNTLYYLCEYNSTYVSVDGYNDLFLSYLNGNLTGLTADMRASNITVIAAQPTGFVGVLTTAPTSSPAPTIAPTSGPTTTIPPSITPSIMNMPVATTDPTPTYLETFSPTVANPGGGGGIPVPAIAAIVVVGGIALLFVLACFFRRRLKNRHRADNVRPARRPARQGEGNVRRGREGDTAMGIVYSRQSGSIESNRSLVSEGREGLDGESGDEMDGTKNLQDEFDQYKDQNLEQLRSDVEGNLSGFEGIMSAAVTKALIMGDDDATKMDPGELFWGCQGNPTGPEVEASALCEVNDWTKRNENASIERKRAFMQDMLNKMVASVRYGVLHAEDASRTIHESAALLGLQLANELPMTTAIISGMRKTTDADQIVKVLQEFGDIDTAAVASGERGFGIVRYRHPKAVERAMRRYRNAEIVVEDVAIQMKVIMPSGEVLSRA